MKIARRMPGMRLVAGAVLALPVAGLLLVSYDAAQYYATKFSIACYARKSMANSTASCWPTASVDLTGC